MVNPVTVDCTECKTELEGNSPDLRLDRSG
jgi:hypothetical protein